MGWVRKARNYLLPWKLRSKDRGYRSRMVTFLKRNFRRGIHIKFILGVNCGGRGRKRRGGTLAW